MNAHTEIQPDLVANAFHLSGTLTAARKVSMLGLSGQIEAIEAALAVRLRGFVEEKRDRTVTEKRENWLQEQDRIRVKRSAAVLACMAQPVTRGDVCDKLRLTRSQAALHMQTLVKENLGVVHGKRGHHWTYLSAAAQAVLDADEVKRLAKLADKARREEARPLSQAQVKQREAIVMHKLGIPRQEIAAKMKLSRQSVTALLKNGGFK